MKVLKQYVIYYNPEDQPGKYVMRTFYVSSGKIIPGEHKLASSLDDARSQVPKEADCRIPRSSADHESVIETWV